MKTFIHIEVLTGIVTCKTLKNISISKVILGFLKEAHVPDKDIESEFKRFTQTGVNTLTLTHYDGSHTFYEVE